MNKIIGYTVGALVGSFFLLGPVLGLYLVSRDTLETLTYTGRDTGVVTACRSARPRSNSSSYIKAPVVERDGFAPVYGTTDEVRFLYECDGLIGKTVPIRFNTEDPNEARIDTFHQMWFMPAVIGLICLVFYGAIAATILRRHRRH